MINFRKISLLIAAIICFFNSNAQTGNRIQDQYRFRSLSIDEGLSNGRVISIEQDKFGIIWLGTVDGLNRYDGYDLTNYYHQENDSSTIPHNRIEEIYSDSRGTLWIGTINGLCTYDYGLNSFKQFNDKRIASGIGQVMDITEDKQGTLWMATYSGIIKYNPTKGELKQYAHKPGNPSTLPDDHLTNILIDNDGRIWTTMYKEGIAVLDITDDSFTIFKSDPLNESTINDNRIETMYHDANGNIWLGAYDNGLNLYDKANNAFIRYYPDSLNKGSGRVRAIFEDSDMNFWLGTQAGLYFFDRNALRFQRYAYTEHPFSSLSHNSIQYALIDNQEGLWLGTFAGGVDYTNLNPMGFTLYKFSHLSNPYFINDKNVYCLAEDRNGDLWIGTEQGGLNHLDRSTGLFTYYKPESGSDNTLLSGNIKEIAVDRYDNLWIGTNRGGLTYFNVAEKKFTNYTHNPDDNTSILHNDIYSLCLDAEDNLWIGTRGGLCYKPVGESYFLPIELNSINLSDNDVGFIEKIIRDPNNGIWMGSPGISGLIYFNPQEEKINLITQFGEHDISGINDLQLDQKNTLWLALRNGGLLSYNTITEKSILYTEQDGLPPITIAAILNDDAGNLWLSSNNGIYCLTNIINDPDSISIKAYDKSNGLQSKQFLLNSKLKSREGELFFGGIAGFNSFYPEKVRDNPYPPKIIFTDIRVNNKPVNVGEEIFGRTLLKKSISETSKIKLHHRIKIFTIEFAGLHYMAPEKNNYAYIMEGYDDWTFVNASRRFATYSNLPPGKYNFKVKASNNSGMWNDEPISLTVQIKPPFWKRIWFYLILALITTLLIVLFITWREKQLRHDKEVLEAKIKEGEKELELKRTQFEEQQKILREKEISEREIRFFNKGLAIFSEILSKKKKNIDELARQLITQLVEYVNASMGGIYLVNTNDPENPVLELAGSFAYDKKGRSKITILPDEGQLGACYRTGETIRIDNLPDRYIKIKSGLGETSPSLLVLIPLKLDQEILGVIEIASFHPIEPYKIAFVEKLSENIYSVIANIQANEMVEKMYEQTHMQSEELQAQEEELRQNLEEMQATQEEASRKEKMLQDEINKLKKQLEALGKS